tara:strand:+ start:1827 stop:1982 length:156 start_codon:yes stop_codon:yes gene_type:complete
MSSAMRNGEPVVRSGHGGTLTEANRFVPRLRFARPEDEDASFDEEWQQDWC